MAHTEMSEKIKRLQLEMSSAGHILAHRHPIMGQNQVIGHRDRVTDEGAAQVCRGRAATSMTLVSPVEQFPLISCVVTGTGSDLHQ